MLQEVEAELATAGSAEKTRLRKRAELIRGSSPTVTKIGFEASLPTLIKGETLFTLGAG
jgi:hypothetical protein